MAPYPSLTYIVNTGQVKIVAILNKADLPDGGGDLVLGPDCIELTPEPAIDSETAIAVSVVTVEGEAEAGVISVVTDEAAALVKRTRQWAAIRVERNVRLAASDFTQLPDIQAKMGEEDKVAWVTYRQALRDFPTGETDPNAPVWPVAPGVIGVVAMEEVVVPVVEPEVVVPVEPVVEQVVVAPVEPEPEVVVTPVEPVVEAPVAPEEPEVVVPVAPEEPEVVVPVAPEEPEVVVPVSPEEPEVVVPVAPDEPVPDVVVTPVEPEVV